MMNFEQKPVTTGRDKKLQGNSEVAEFDGRSLEQHVTSISRAKAKIAVAENYYNTTLQEWFYIQIKERKITINNEDDLETFTKLMTSSANGYVRNLEVEVIDLTEIDVKIESNSQKIKTILKQMASLKKENLNENFTIPTIKMPNIDQNEALFKSAIKYLPEVIFHNFSFATFDQLGLIVFKKFINICILVIKAFLDSNSSENNILDPEKLKSTSHVLSHLKPHVEKFASDSSFSPLLKSEFNDCLQRLCLCESILEKLLSQQPLAIGS